MPPCCTGKLFFFKNGYSNSLKDWAACFPWCAAWKPQLLLLYNNKHMIPVLRNLSFIYSFSITLAMQTLYANKSLIEIYRIYL